MDQPNQLQIQNALRTLTKIIPKDATLIFEGGDLISINSKEINHAYVRTQDLAEILCSRK